MSGNWRLAALAAALVLGVSAGAAAQETYPEPGKTLRLMVGFGTGGGTDLAARVLAEGLEKQLGIDVVVENYPSGGGLMAINHLLAAEPDGYTLAFSPLPATNMLYLDPERGGTFTPEDLIPIAVHDVSEALIVVAPSSPWNSLTDLLEDARQHPGTITAASNGVLGGGHITLLQLRQAAGADINWISYDEAGPMRAAMLGGHIQAEMVGREDSFAAYKNGDIKVLAVFAKDRIAGWEDVPTALEQGIDLTLPASTRVLLAPAGTPPEIIAVLEGAVRDLTADPEYQELATARGLNLGFLDSEGARQRWAEIDGIYGPLVEEFRRTGAN